MFNNIDTSSQERPLSPRFLQNDVIKKYQSAVRRTSGTLPSEITVSSESGESLHSDFYLDLSKLEIQSS